MRWTAVLPAVVGGGCGGAQGAAHVLVSVESVGIADTGRWDAAAAEDDGGDLEALGALIGLADATLGGVVSALGQLATSGSEGGEARVENPDPVLRITLDEGATTTERESSVIASSLQPDWRYATYLWTGSLRESGIELAVVDRDGDDGGERIGGARVSRSALEEAAHDGGASITIRDGSLEQLRVRIEPADASAVTHREIRMPLTAGLVASGVSAPEGAVIEIRVTGGGRISSGRFFSCGRDVTPAGLAPGQCDGYNLNLFRDAPHGAPVALIGRGTQVQAVDLSTGATESAACVRFVSSGAGPIVLGINDTDLGNDAGELARGIEALSPVERERG